MPELPEVDTICNQLTHHLPLANGPLQITHWKEFVHTHKIIKLREFRPKDQFICKIERHGKKILFHTLDKNLVCSQLGMSGQWRIWDTAPSILPKHTHLVIKFNSGHTLAYVDPRRFGRLLLIKSESTPSYWNIWGDDILSPNFTLQKFTESIALYPQRLLKVTLLDQKLFPGIGNYIASEICAWAKILPTRFCKDLNKTELKKLYVAISQVIHSSLDLGGNTFQGGYVDANGEKGAGLKGLLVFYQKICNACKKTPVSKIMLAQRGTYFCSHCQK